MNLCYQEYFEQLYLALRNNLIVFNRMGQTPPKNERSTEETLFPQHLTLAFVHLNYVLGPPGPEGETGKR